MSQNPKPETKPAQPFFSSGPCAKRPGWRPDVLGNALVGRSHRSSDGRKRLKLAIDLTREALRLPPGYEAAIVPGSDTGALELAMWNLLGPRGVDVLAWDVFGRNWVHDVVEELKLPDVRRFEAEPGHLPLLAKVDFSRDVIFTWNGTTTGVRVPDGNWIPDDRSGLTFTTGDALALPVADGTFDAATIAFGMRNLADYRQGFAEMVRAVKPGGRVVCLEIARPQSLFARAAQAWFDRIVPIIGRIAGQKAAYSYLVSSTQDYPDPPRIADIMRDVGLVDVSWQPMTLGIVTLHVGHTPG